MTVTILAVVFLCLMLIVTYFGYRFMFRTKGQAEQTRLERCSICRLPFPQARLIERQSGDTRVYRFCDGCIKGLYNDLMSRN
jgi:hypothetical protein